MPQSPIPAQAFLRKPSKMFAPIVGNAQGAIPPARIFGNSYFVHEGTGDDSNDGSAASPFATLTKALASCTANNGDAVYLIGTVHVTATVAWNKDGVDLIGLSAPSDNDRARISGGGTVVFTPMVNVTAQGCRLENVATFYGYNSATAQVCWAEAGGRNYYKNCQFLGGGNATAAAQAGMRSLTVAGNGENLFEGCTIGLDTVVRATAANASLELLAGTPRNVFRNCIFQALSQLATNVHVKVGAAGMDRYALFDNCTFMNAVESTATAMNAAIAADAAAGGAVMVQGGMSLGATAIATTGPVYGNGASPTAATSSIGIKLT